MDIRDRTTIKLSNLGLIIPSSVTGEFSLGCQALQDCVILSQSSQHKKPKDHPPCSDGKLNVLQALELALPCFDFSHLQNAYRFATKKSEFPTKNGEDVLKEAVYSGSVFISDFRIRIRTFGLLQVSLFRIWTSHSLYFGFQIRSQK